MRDTLITPYTSALRARARTSAIDAGGARYAAVVVTALFCHDATPAALLLRVTARGRCYHEEMGEYGDIEMLYHAIMFEEEQVTARCRFMLILMPLRDLMCFRCRYFAMLLLAFDTLTAVAYVTR